MTVKRPANSGETRSEGQYIDIHDWLYRPSKLQRLRSAIRQADRDGRRRDAYYLRSQFIRLCNRLIEMVKRA